MEKKIVEPKIKREIIIKCLSEILVKQNTVYAFWLEGADGLNKVDEFSDLDFVADVEDGFEDEIFELVESELFKLGKMDICYLQIHSHPKLRQKVYHLEMSSPYLEIDFCIQSHSRDKSGSTFFEKDKIEFPKVLFDKKQVVQFRSRNQKDFEELDKNNAVRIKYLQSVVNQHHRILKYVERNKFIEAWSYFQKHIIEPLIEILRMQYTPFHSSYSIVHINDHLPKNELEQLEKYFRVKSVEEIREMTIKGVNWFGKLVCENADNAASISFVQKRGLV